jgi:hypothetical protein
MPELNDDDYRLLILGLSIAGVLAAYGPEKPALKEGLEHLRANYSEYEQLMGRIIEASFAH